VLHKTLIALAAAVALGCVPAATNALAAGHPGGHGGGGHGGGGHAMGGHAMGGHAMGGHARGGYARGGHVARYGGGYRSGPIYDSCPGYAYGYNNGCVGYGVPLVGGLINGVLGGYGPF
jgi:hypothetical protein